MPVTIYPSTLKIRDTNGSFHSADCIKGDAGPQGLKGDPGPLPELDASPTAGSSNAVSSGGVKTAIDNAVAAKQDALTFDEVPTANSNNPVKSNGIKLLIDAIANTIPRKVSDLTDDSGHYTKPNGGIPASDLADGVIPDVTGKQDLLLFDARPTLQSSNPVTSNGIKQAIDTAYNQVSGETDIKLLGKVDRVSECTEGNFAALDENGNLVDSGSKASDFLTEHQTIPVTDVQVNGTSVLSNGVANVPIASSSTLGVMKSNTTYGLNINENGELYTLGAGDAHIKTGDNLYRPITPGRQHQSVFYGLAKAAGDTTQSKSNNAVGTYTEIAQSKIHEMLDAPITISGRNPVITGKAGIRYVCGECDTLTLTPPSSGIVDVVFTSGTTPTVLSVPSTVKWPGWFDPSSLDASTTYELNIMDVVYGAVAAWT